MVIPMFTGSISSDIFSVKSISAGKIETRTNVDSIYNTEVLYTTRSLRISLSNGTEINLHLYADDLNSLEIIDNP